MTAREKDILRLIAQAYNDREIAEKLAATGGTARSDIQSLCAKIGVRDRLSAVLYLLEHLDDDLPPASLVA